MLEIALAVIGIGQFCRVVLGHGIDGQVASDQVFFQGHFGAGVEDEATVAAAAFALGAGQGIFLTGLRVEKYRKSAADRAKSLGQHVLGRGADHHPSRYR